MSDLFAHSLTDEAKWANARLLHSDLKIGDMVQPGDVLCIIETATGLEKIRANRAGVVEGVFVCRGDTINPDELLFTFKPLKSGAVKPETPVTANGEKQTESESEAKEEEASGIQMIFFGAILVVTFLFSRFALIRSSDQIFAEGNLPPIVVSTAVFTLIVFLLERIPFLKLKSSPYGFTSTAALSIAIFLGLGVLSETVGSWEKGALEYVLGPQRPTKVAAAAGRKIKDGSSSGSGEMKSREDRLKYPGTNKSLEEIQADFAELGDKQWAERRQRALDAGFKQYLFPPKGRNDIYVCQSLKAAKAFEVYAREVSDFGFALTLLPEDDPAPGKCATFNARPNANVMLRQGSFIKVRAKFDIFDANVDGSENELVGWTHSAHLRNF